MWSSSSSAPPWLPSDELTSHSLTQHSTRRAVHVRFLTVRDDECRMQLAAAGKLWFLPRHRATGDLSITTARRQKEKESRRRLFHQLPLAVASGVTTGEHVAHLPASISLSDARLYCTSRKDVAAIPRASQLHGNISPVTTTTRKNIGGLLHFFPLCSNKLFFGRIRSISSCSSQLDRVFYVHPYIKCKPTVKSTRVNLLW